VTGKAKDITGQVTGQPGLTMKGKAENLMGKVQEKVGDYKEKQKEENRGSTKPVWDNKVEGDI